MSAQTLRNLNRNNQEQQASGPVNFPALLKASQAEIARALPKHINPDRMARIALTAFRQTPKLAECDPMSVLACVIQSSQLGLEVGLMGEAHLVPFGKQCQLIPGYTGLMKLARQSGQVIDIYAHEVYVKDKFKLMYGLERSLEHEPMKAEGGFPASAEARGHVVGFYAVAVLKDGSKTFVALSVDDAKRIRDNSKGYQASKKYNKESPWDTDFVPMGLKTAIRALCKHLPKSPELQDAMALDNAANNGKDQNLNINDVINGTYQVVEDDEGDATPTSAPETPVHTAPNGSAQQESKSASTQTSQQATGASTASNQSNKREPVGTPIGNACAELEKATNIADLDEVYVRAEGLFDGQDLEVLLRKYREVKAKIDAAGNGQLNLS